jgi:hypothetical protein
MQIDSHIFVRCSLQTLFTVQISLTIIRNFNHHSRIRESKMFGARSATALLNSKSIATMAEGHWHIPCSVKEQLVVMSGYMCPSQIARVTCQLKDEYQCHIGHKEDDALPHHPTSNIAITKKYPLTNRISGPGGSNLYCNCCKKCNHIMDNCRHLGKPLCTNCGCFGHMTEACYRNGNVKCKRGNDTKTTQNKYNNNKEENPQKKGKYNQTNVVEEEVSAVAIAEVEPQ